MVLMVCGEMVGYGCSGTFYFGIESQIFVSADAGVRDVEVVTEGCVSRGFRGKQDRCVGDERL